MDGLIMRRTLQYLRHRLDPTVRYAKFEDHQLPPAIELAHGVTLAAAVGSLLTNKGEG